jgi:hypothetical protein
MKSNLITPMMTLLLLVSLLAASAGAFVFAKRIQPGIDFDGPHHNLLIHGVPDGVDKFKDDTIGSGRHSIFLPLNTVDPITIQFSMSEDLNWTVTDCDATGDGTAGIILPRYMFVDDDEDPLTPDVAKRVNSYKVYLVSLGKPGENEMVISPRAEFTDSSGKVYYYWGDVTYEGHKNKKHGGADTGQPNWQNATDLFLVDTTLWNDTDVDGVVDQEWNDLNENGIVDSPEWTDTNGNFIVDPGEWTDIDLDGVVDSDEWVDADGDFVVDNELIVYEDEWVFNIKYLDGYWWDMQNSGVRLMQVRFYPVFNGK